MNTDQLNSLIRSVLKIIGTALLAHGYTTAGTWLGAEEIIGAIIAVAGFIASHNWHKDESQPPAPKFPVSSFIILTSSLAFCGCIATNPLHRPGDATTPAYIVDTPRITNNTAAAQTVAAVAAPVVAAVAPVAAPLAPFAVPLTDVVGSLIVLLSGVFAWYKNRQAAKQEAAAAALAAAVPLDRHATALNIATGNASTAEVATHLQNAQSLT